MVAVTRIQLSEPGCERVIINLAERNNTVTIGNAPKSSTHIRLQSQNPYISRFHCTVTRVDGQIFIRDGALVEASDKSKTWRHSTKGTYVNDEQLIGDEPKELNLHDTVCLGDPTDPIYTGYRITLLADETQNDLTSTQADADNALIVRECANESLTRNECGVLGLEVLAMGLGTRIRYTDASAETNLGFQAGELSQTINEVGLEQILARSEVEQVNASIETAIAQGRVVSGTYERMTGGKVMISLCRKLLDADMSRFYVMALVYGISHDGGTIAHTGIHGSTVESSNRPLDKERVFVDVADRILTFMEVKPVMGWCVLILWSVTVSMLVLLVVQLF